MEVCNQFGHGSTAGLEFECFRRDLFARYAPNPWEVHDAHSIFFEILGEHGFIGLALYLMLGIMAWRTGSWIKRTAKNNPEIKWMADLASMVQVSMVAYAVGRAFLGLAYFDLYYHLIAILVLCKVIFLKHQEAQVAETNIQLQNLPVASRPGLTTGS